MKKTTFVMLYVGIIAIHCRGSSNIGVKQGNDGNSGVFQPNNLTRASATISSAGGYINVGHTQLVIPAGAVEADTKITAELQEFPENIPGAKHLGKGVRFSPEGLQFLIPAELLLCYDSAATSGLNESSAMVYYRDENDNAVAIAGTVDPIRRCVKSHIEHFSSYVGAAFQEFAGNTAPTIGGANFLPATPFAGIPLRVRTQINDMNGSGATGTIVSAFLNYRTVGAPTYTKVALQPDLTDDTVTNRYSYLIPAANVTLAGIEYYFEATDNLNITRTTAPTIRTVPSAATELRLNPVTTASTPLKIASGFARALTLQAADNLGGPWRNISLESFSISTPQLGIGQKTTPSALRFQGQAAGTGTVSATAGALTAVLYAEVVPGLLDHITITDANQVEITGTYMMGINQVLNFDVVGFDAYGNNAKILPAFATTGGIGSVTVDALGGHFTAGAGATTGMLTATVGGLTDTLDFFIYVPPVVASTAPVDGATGINYTNAGVAITFSKSMDTNTLTANMDNTCSGSVQVSADNFSTCVAMTSSTPQFFISDTLLMLNVAAPLAGGSVYRIRVLNSAKDTFGYPLPTTYTSTTGFTTVPDVTTPAIGSAITFTNVRNRDLTINWGAATDDSTSAANLQYKVVKDNISAANINTVALADAKTGADLIQDWQSGITSKVATGLNGTTTYHFAVLVRDAAGNRTLYGPATQATTTWMVTGNMAVGREHQSATLLGNGRILIAGGAASNVAQSTAEVFDPSGNNGFGAFLPTAAMSQARTEHTATRLGDGRVLIAGGRNYGSYLSSAEIFDANGNLGNGSFANTNAMSVQRQFHTATMLTDGRILIAGGYNNTGMTASSEIFDSVANGGFGAFQASPSMISARRGHTATRLLDGRVLIVGGQSNGNVILAVAEIFDPNGNNGAGSFTAAGSMTFGRAFHTASLLPDGRVIVSGGVNASFAPQNSAEVFDPVGNGGIGAFAATPTMPFASAFFANSVLPGGRILMTGGDPGGGNVSAVANVFDPLLNSGMGGFISAQNMSSPRRNHTSTPLMSGSVLICGGYNGSYLNSCEIFE